ncbi:hypothetical protein PFISCL1PPCAC_16516 [Pristionchus fissidentatus]|uniref:tRNA (guanine(9)-N(1))-methyltransferase n=1 Tax=Pristionchus fissidentatus TaxID=1538716 RepID=A0AAV5W020_9BILA|nr:hypothetical protein PFISCL1PPCAC_16516 [Pristionchus fissidentatus]
MAETEGAELESTVAVKEELKQEVKEDGMAAEDTVDHEEGSIDDGNEGEENGQEEGGEKLSKRELKRRANMPKYLEYRKKKRADERQRKKDRKAALKAAGQGETMVKAPRRKMAESDCKLRLVVDMAFDDLMVERDRRRCISQLTYCYSANRKADQPTQYHIVGFGGPTRTIYDSNDTYVNWDVHLHREPLEEVVAKEDIVYLTAESDNVLTELDDSKAYIIGGLVDHNSHKGVCFAKAQEKGWAHARLPIDEFVKMQSRKVLTVNHVFEIMVVYWATKDWEKAFFTVIPQRKGAMKKEEEEAADEQASGMVEEVEQEESTVKTEEISA